MHDIEFVKLRHWVDSELTQIKIFLAIILGIQLHRPLVWWLVGAYVLFSILYVATRIAYIEALHKGYMDIRR